MRTIYTVTLTSPKLSSTITLYHDDGYHIALSAMNYGRTENKPTLTWHFDDYDAAREKYESLVSDHAVHVGTICGVCN